MSSVREAKASVPQNAEYKELQETYLVPIKTKNITCPISLQIFYDPVYIGCCSHTFERDMIINSTHCPLCKRKITGITPAINTRDLVLTVIDHYPEVANECYFSIHHLAAILKNDEAIFPELLIKILSHSNHLNAISVVPGYEGGTALTELVSYPKGIRLLKQYPKILANITPEGLNSALEEGDYEGTSALYWLVADSTSVNLLQDQQLLSKITSEGLNRVITKEGTRTGASPLYWLSWSTVGIEILKNKELQKKITITGLNSFFKGRPPVYCLACCPQGRNILIRSAELRNKITSESLNAIENTKGYKGTSAVSYLMGNPEGVELLLEDALLRAKINSESINSLCYLKDNPPATPIKMLTESKDGIRLLLKDEKLTEKITQETLNSKDSYGTSPLFWLTLSPEGIQLLSNNKNLRDKITYEGLYGKSTNLESIDQSALFHLTRSMQGLELLFKDDRLLNLISLSDLVQPAPDTTPLNNLLHSTIGRKILQKKFNTPDDVCTLYCLITQGNNSAFPIEQLINSLTPEFLKSIYSDKTKLDVLLKELKAQDGILFLDKVYGIKVTLEEYEINAFALDKKTHILQAEEKTSLTLKSNCLSPGDFKNAVESGMPIVDKTVFIQIVIDDSNLQIALSLPAKVGKTFNLTMLKAFIDINEKRDFFSGTKIEKVLNAKKYKQQYPVIYVPLKNIETANEDEAFKSFTNIVVSIIDESLSFISNVEHFRKRQLVEEVESIKSSKEPIGHIRIIDLIPWLMEVLNSHYKKRVWLLIDDLDPNKFRNISSKFSELIRRFIHRINKDNSDLEKSIIIGPSNLDLSSHYMAHPRIYKLHQAEGDSTTWEKLYSSCFGLSSEENMKLKKLNEISEVVLSSTGLFKPLATHVAEYTLDFDSYTRMYYNIF